MTRVYYTTHIHDKNEYSDVARCLLRYALLHDYGITDPAIMKDDRGKPYVCGHSDIHISITHTDGLIACAVSDIPVGIDAECIGKIRPRIAEKLFTKNEREYIGTSSECFFDVWTKKESFAKMTGDGITHAICNIDVVSGQDINDVAFKTIDINGIPVCVCTETAAEITINDLTDTEFEGVIL